MKKKVSNDNIYNTIDNNSFNNKNNKNSKIINESFNNDYKQLKEEGYALTLKQIQHIKHKECWDWISDQYWTNQYLIDLHTMKINMICEELVKQNGDTRKTLEILAGKIPYLSKRFIEIIKYKEAYSDISDTYFMRNEFK